jgi:N-acetylneuraminic acid mutarotase
LRAPRGGHAAVVLGGKIHVLGGGNLQSTIADHSVFDPETNKWSELKRLRPAVYRSGLYVFGGESQIQAKTLNAVMRLSSLRGAWRRVSKLPTARNYARAVAFKDAVYVVGGSRVAGDSHAAAGSNVVERFFIRR